jgi:hypothetical protein
VARTHGRIQHRIWQDGDFLALTESAQRFYMLALSLPDLSYAGVVPFTVRRWAKLAADSSQSRIRKACQALVTARFVLVDEDTEELMLRSFVRHDGILDNPNVSIAAVKDFRSIHSPLLRAVFLVELRRLHDEGEGRPEVWAGGRLGDLLVEPYPEPLPEALPEALGVALPLGLAQALDVRARTPSPSPTPAPAPREVA